MAILIAVYHAILAVAEKSRALNRMSDPSLLIGGGLQSKAALLAIFQSPAPLKSGWSHQLRRERESSA